MPAHEVLKQHSVINLLESWVLYSCCLQPKHRDCSNHDGQLSNHIRGKIAARDNLECLTLMRRYRYDYPQGKLPNYSQIDFGIFALQGQRVLVMEKLAWKSTCRFTSLWTWKFPLIGEGWCGFKIQSNWRYCGLVRVTVYVCWLP